MKKKKRSGGRIGRMAMPTSMMTTGAVRPLERLNTATHRSFTTHTILVSARRTQTSTPQAPPLLLLQTATKKVMLILMLLPPPRPTASSASSICERRQCRCHQHQHSHHHRLRRQWEGEEEEGLRTMQILRRQSHHQLRCIPTPPRPQPRRFTPRPPRWPTSATPPLGSCRRPSPSTTQREKRSATSYSLHLIIDPHHHHHH